jgi:periplasmic divalent cation tolerance protein
MEYIEIVTTSDNKSVLQRIADSLVRKKLAACVQLVQPVTSTYRWKGKVAHAREYMCIIKTRRSAYARVEKEILRSHNYSLPQITSVRISGSKGYLDWISKEVK